MANFWYSYKGTGDPTLSTNYALLKNVKPGCLNGVQICNIYVPGGGASPLAPLPSNIQNYIAAALSSQIAEPQIPAGTKFFVYLKNP